MEFLISYQMQLLFVFLCYSLDNTVLGSRITFIMCSFLVQRFKHTIVTMLNCIHAHHISNNLNCIKPQSHVLSHTWIHQPKMSCFFFWPCRCTSLTQVLKNCEETNSRGFDRTGIAWLKEERWKKKERRKRRRKSGKSGFSTNYGATQRKVGQCTVISSILWLFFITNNTI